MARVLVVSAVAAVCIAVLISAFFSRNRKTVEKMAVLERARMPGQETEPPKPFAGHGAKTAGNTRPTRGSWANSLLPFYSLGILAYIVFVVGKIMTRQYSGRRREPAAGPSWMSKRPNKGNAKTKITMHEIRQLEERLMETEEAVQQIIANASKTLEIASKMDSQEDSEEEMHRLEKRTRISTKRKAEGNSAPKAVQFQDDSSSEGEERHPIAPQFRKRVMVKKQTPATRESKGQSSSSDEEKVVLLRRKKTASPRGSEETNGRTRSRHTSTDASNDDEHNHRGLSGNRSSMHPDSSTMSSKDDESLSDNGNLMATANNIQESMAEIHSYIEREKMQSVVDF